MALLKTKPKKMGPFVFDCETKYSDDVVVETCFNASNYFDFLALNNSDIVLDIGGHLGAFAVPASRLSHRVISFEPMPSKFQLLERHLHRHDCMNLIPINAAITSSHQLTVGIEHADKGWKAIYATQSTVHQHHGFSFFKFVQNRHIGDVIDGMFPTKMKIDCEGAELEILRWLIPNMPLSMLAIAMELHPGHAGLSRDYVFELGAAFTRIGWDWKVNFLGYPTNQMMYAWSPDFVVLPLCQTRRTPNMGFTCKSPLH